MCRLLWVTAVLKQFLYTPIINHNESSAIEVVFAVAALLTSKLMGIMYAGWLLGAKTLINLGCQVELAD